MNLVKIKTQRLALSREEVAQTLGISTKSVDRLVQRGLLHPSRALRRPLFLLSEIERLLRDTSEQVDL